MRVNRFVSLLLTDPVPRQLHQRLGAGLVAANLFTLLALKHKVVLAVELLAEITDRLPVEAHRTRAPWTLVAPDDFKLKNH